MDILHTDKFVYACETNDFSTIKYILETHTNIKHLLFDTQTYKTYNDIFFERIICAPFIIAVLNGFTDIVKLLLEYDKEQLKLKTPVSNISALMISTCYGYSHIMKLLLCKVKGIEHELEHVDVKKRTILMYATMNGDLEIVKMVINTKKAQLDYTDMYGRTALYYAITCSRYIYRNKIVKLLLSTQQSNPSSRDVHNMTLLEHTFCYNFHHTIVKLLLATYVDWTTSFNNINFTKLRHMDKYLPHYIQKRVTMKKHNHMLHFKTLIYTPYIYYVT